MKNNIQNKMTIEPDQGTQLSNIKPQNFKSDLVKISDGLFNCPLTLVDGNIHYITMREDDGYINATLLCKVSGKDIREWKKTNHQKNY